MITLQSALLYSFTRVISMFMKRTVPTLHVTNRLRDNSFRIQRTAPYLLTYLAKTAFPLELTLVTLVIHTQTKPGSHGALPGDLGGGVGSRRTGPTAKGGAMRNPRCGKRVNPFP